VTMSETQINIFAYTISPRSHGQR